MNAFEAITFARKHLSEHFNLTLLIDAQDGRHVGRMHGHNDAADAYNALAKLHTMIDESGNFRKSRRSSR